MAERKGKFAAPPGAMPDGSQWRGRYRLKYTSGATGAQVFCESGWKPSDNGEELIISRLLADGGISVVLRRERNVAGQADIDAFVLRPSGVEEVEFKRITPAAKPQRSSQTHIERAIEQGASHVLLFLDRDAADADTLQRITDGIRSGLRDDEDGTILHKVSVLLRDGTLMSRTRRELDDGGRF